ncbi:hypothetical protein R0381_003441 [Jeongeupia wiesaeckerbachi]|uniref:hypothetical protein n=1 Tax=Jeongeupia wiesaeckerbachi TaxID=3051218 RepID=UPI003D809BB8
MHFAVHALFISTALLLAACGPAAEKSQVEAAISFKEKCTRRLENRKNMPSEIAQKFCSCLLKEASKRYNPNELDSRMDGSADRAFKDDLNPANNICLSQINSRP